MSTGPHRARNRRGEGARLREEIITAATTLLETGGSEDAVTLRGVARQAGIAAPSIYAHFPDREAIITAVIARAFAELDDALAAAVRGEDDPPGRLRRLCEAYLAFAEDRPHRYRVAFDRHRVTANATTRTVERPEDLAGGAAFDRLVAAIGDCAQAGRPVRWSPRLDATALWVSLHGYAALNTGVPAFPWPGRQQMLDMLLERDPPG